MVAFFSSNQKTNIHNPLKDNQSDFLCGNSDSHRSKLPNEDITVPKNMREIRDARASGKFGKKDSQTAEQPAKERGFFGGCWDSVKGFVSKCWNFFQPKSAELPLDIVEESPSDKCEELPSDHSSELL
jgi:hypothetical protein